MTTLVLDLGTSVISQVETPCGTSFGPVDKDKIKICLVSVVRSGEIMISLG